MDFKSLMAAQISKSKSQPKAASKPSQNSTDTSPISTTNKYLRRSDIEAAREASYAAEQARLEAEREERAAKKRKLEEEEAERNAVREEKKRRLAEESKRRREEEEKEEERRRRRRLGLPEVPDAIEDGDTNVDGELDGVEQEEIEDDELRSRLRELNEPASLFDETHFARLKRYYTILAKKNKSPATSSTSTALNNGPIPTTLLPVPEKDMLLPSTVPPLNDKPAQQFLSRQLASYFTLILSEWSLALQTRSEDVKSSTTGRAAHTSYLSVLKDLTPLFRHFERQSLPNDLLEPIVQILRACQERRYVDANDGYLTLSIGKAAWPIGVTMVGIHERSAREKLHESSSAKQAHILSDEVTRKFLQSIKRCLSFAQTRWPPEDLAQLMG